MRVQAVLVVSLCRTRGQVPRKRRVSGTLGLREGRKPEAS